jgi:hypothetical protein
VKSLIVACLIALLAACSERTTTAAPGAEALKTYPAHGRQVRIVRGELPAGAVYEVLGKVKAIEDYYGELSSAERKIADQARSIGADAVINEKAWHAPRAFAWAVPHAEGIAVKITKPESVDLGQVPGWWY